jgi:PilZ domain-containing protein
MSKYDHSADGTAAGKEAMSQQSSQEAGTQETSEGRKRRFPYTDMQSAPRFPIKLPMAVKSQSGARPAETQNISANGVLFQVDADMPVGSMVDFTISLPADVVGTDSDVQLDCRGRVVRSFDQDGRHGVGVVIDEYRFERR